MGGRKPTSPSVIPGTPPRGMTDNTGDFDILMTPQPVPPRGRRGRRRNPRGRRVGRNLSNEEKMRINAKYQERKRLRRQKGYAERGTIDKQGNRVGGGVGPRRDPRRPVGILGAVGSVVKNIYGIGGPTGDRPVTGRRTGRRTGGVGPRRDPRRPVGRRVGRRVVSRPPRGERDRYAQNIRRSILEDGGRPIVSRPIVGRRPGESPIREIDIPREKVRPIERSGPSGPAPFTPYDTSARDRFYDSMFDKAAQKQSASQERSEQFRGSREVAREKMGMMFEDMRESSGRDEARERKQMMKDEKRSRRDSMRAERRMKKRDFTRKRSRMEGGKRGRSREERAAFRDRYVSTLRR